MARAGLSRHVITQEALALIDEGGVRAFDELTLSAIAARLGVTSPSLYKHVRSLADLRRDVAIAAVRDLSQTLGDATMGRAGDTAVVALADALRAFATHHPGRYLCAQHAGNPNDPDDAELIDAGTETVTIIAAALRDYRFTPDQNTDAIRAIRAAIHGFVLLELEGGFGMPRHPDSSYSALIRMLIRGLAELANG